MPGPRMRRGGGRPHRPRRALAPSQQAAPARRCGGGDGVMPGHRWMREQAGPALPFLRVRRAGSSKAHAACRRCCQCGLRHRSGPGGRVHSVRSRVLTPYPTWELSGPGYGIMIMMLGVSVCAAAARAGAASLEPRSVCGGSGQSQGCTPTRSQTDEGFVAGRTTRTGTGPD